MNETQRNVNKEDDEELTLPVKMTTTTYQDENVTFENNELLIQLNEPENNIIRVKLDFLNTKNIQI